MLWYIWRFGSNGAYFDLTDLHSELDCRSSLVDQLSRMLGNSLWYTPGASDSEINLVTLQIKFSVLLDHVWPNEIINVFLLVQRDMTKTVTSDLRCSWPIMQLDRTTKIDFLNLVPAWHGHPHNQAESYFGYSVSILPCYALLVFEP